MSEQIGPGPYNLRGALINPSGNQTYNYYLMFLDLGPSSKLTGAFVYKDIKETGNQLNYLYMGDPSDLVAPLPGENVTTVYLPIYFNQLIDQPDLTTGAQNLWVNILSSDGSKVIATGNPYERHPPIVEVVENNESNPTVEKYICSSISLNSATATNPTSVIVVMVNSCEIQAVNPLIIQSIQNNSGNYDLFCNFTLASENQPWSGGPIAAVGACLNGDSLIQNVYMDPNNFDNPPSRPLNWNPNPPPDTIPPTFF